MGTFFSKQSENNNDTVYNTGIEKFEEKKKNAFEKVNIASFLRLEENQQGIFDLFSKIYDNTPKAFELFTSFPTRELIKYSEIKLDELYSLYNENDLLPEIISKIWTIRSAGVSYCKKKENILDLQKIIEEAKKALRTIQKIDNNNDEFSQVDAFLISRHFNFGLKKISKLESKEKSEFITFKTVILSHSTNIAVVNLYREYQEDPEFYNSLLQSKPLIHALYHKSTTFSDLKELYNKDSKKFIEVASDREELEKYIKIGKDQQNTAPFLEQTMLISSNAVRDTDSTEDTVVFDDTDSTEDDTDGTEDTVEFGDTENAAVLRDTVDTAVPEDTTTVLGDNTEDTVDTAVLQDTTAVPEDTTAVLGDTGDTAAQDSTSFWGSWNFW